MSTLNVSDIPLASDNPSQRLRRLAAAVRVSLHWWGVHRALTNQQKEEVSAGYAADARFLTAGKKIIDGRHEAFRRLTSIRTRLGNSWRGLTLPYTEPGMRLVRQSDIEAFVHTMEGFREELTQAEAELNAVFEELKRTAQAQLGRLYDAGDYPPRCKGCSMWNGISRPSNRRLTCCASARRSTKRKGDVWRRGSTRRCTWPSKPSLPNSPSCFLASANGSVRRKTVTSGSSVIRPSPT
jgi:hypothetical protein